MISHQCLSIFKNKYIEYINNHDLIDLLSITMISKPVKKVVYSLHVFLHRENMTYQSTRYELSTQSK